MNQNNNNNKSTTTHLLLHSPPLLLDRFLDPFRGTTGGVGGEAVGHEDGANTGCISVVELVEANQNGIVLGADLLAGLVEPNDTATHLWRGVKGRSVGRCWGGKRRMRGR